MIFLFVLSQEDMNTENKAVVTLDRIEPMNVKRIKKIIRWQIGQSTETTEVHAPEMER